MAIATRPVAQLSNMLIHHYFMAPAPTIGQEAAPSVPPQAFGGVCQARLEQRCRQPDGTLTARWQTL